MTAQNQKQATSVVRMAVDRANASDWPLDIQALLKQDWLVEDCPPLIGLCSVEGNVVNTWLFFHTAFDDVSATPVSKQKVSHTQRV